MSWLRSRVESAWSTLNGDSRLQATLKHTGWLTGSSAMVIVLAGLQGILTARILGVADWGMLGVAISFYTVINLLLSFRMREFVVKWVTQAGEDGGTASSAFKLGLAGEVATAVLAFTVVEITAGWGAAAFAKNPDVAWVFRAVALVVLFQAGQQSLVGMLHVHRAFRTQSLVESGVQFASVCGMAVVYLSGGGIQGVVIVWVGAAALASVLIWILGLRAARAVLPAGWTREPIRLGQLGPEMWRFLILGNFRGTTDSLMSYGDLLVLGFLRSPVEVGYYKLAKAIAQIANLPNVPLYSAWFPELSAAAAAEKWGEFRTLVRRGSKAAALWIVPVTLVVAIAAQPAIALLYGPDFLPAAPALYILLIGVVVDVVLFWGQTALLSLGEPGYLASVSLTGTVTKYGLAFLLVPVGGYLALAAAQSFVMVLMNVLAAWRVTISLRTREAVSIA